MPCGPAVFSFPGTSQTVIAQRRAGSSGVPSRAQLPTGKENADLELRGTADQQLIYLNTHWGRQYAFEPPQTLESEWTATAKFGGYAVLQAQTAAELLEEVRAHYQANKPEDQQGGGS